jgi:hypothetical protein
MTHEARAVLEAILYGHDPDIKPSDRLRAAEALGALKPAATLTLAEQMVEMTDEALQTECDQIAAADLSMMLAEVPEERARLWPSLNTAVEAYVDVRLQEARRTAGR